MRANEFITEKKKRKNRKKKSYGYGYGVDVDAGSSSGVGESIDEGWKDTLGNLAIAGGVALGGAGGMAAKHSMTSPGVDNKPASVSQVTTPKIQPPEIVSKKVQDEPKTQNTTISNPHEKLLIKVATAAGIKGTELAAFLAQTAHESHDFQSMVEYGGSLDFRKYDPKYAPKKAKVLGNTKPGDGAKYKGRGYIQITGKYNYAKASKELGIDLVKNPKLAEKPEVAAKIAVWYWKLRVQPNVDNFNNVEDVTKPINPGMRGLEDRIENFKDYKTLVASL